MNITKKLNKPQDGLRRQGTPPTQEEISKKLAARRASKIIS